MTDYNDGKWHGWNGGECPVHPQSVVEWYGKQGRFSKMGGFRGYSGIECALDVDWTGEQPLVAFRVTKPYVEPPNAREIWINEYPGMLTACLHKSADAARDGLGNTIGKTTRWIEVLE